MYPSKGHLLFSNWETFKQKIRKYYEGNIQNEYCKQLLKSAISSTNIDAQDYLYTILLNAVLPSTARFKCDSGKRTKKATILDSQESLVLRLTTLNDYRGKINSIINKYYSAGITIQPFIIVHGLSESELISFYVYFNDNLIKLNSFIESLDICFKIFHTLSLKYPEACVNSWMFIQKYFYNIQTVFDFKSVNVASLISFLQQ
ncbi:uncharacterized protein LOC142242535 [Haematobia irritans]|uniref:uncharacterized protein LOC142242535 n=1 Tax=Haematobia irritans TaxID=7368 RepID=UPI003F4FDC78